MCFPPLSLLYIHWKFHFLMEHNLRYNPEHEIDSQRLFAELIFEILLPHLTERFLSDMQISSNFLCHSILWEIKEKRKWECEANKHLAVKRCQWKRTRSACLHPRLTRCRWVANKRISNCKSCLVWFCSCRTSWVSIWKAFLSQMCLSRRLNFNSFFRGKENWMKKWKKLIENWARNLISTGKVNLLDFQKRFHKLFWNFYLRIFPKSLIIFHFPCLSTSNYYLYRFEGCKFNLFIADLIDGNEHKLSSQKKSMNFCMDINSVWCTNELLTDTWSITVRAFTQKKN